MKLNRAIGQIALIGIFFLAPAAPAWAVTFGETGTGNNTINNLDGRQRATQFVCGANGSVNRLLMYISGTGSGDEGRMAIYASGGTDTPGVLLAQSSSQALITGWNTFDQLGCGH